MTSWRGLLRKEWMLMRNSLIVFVGINLFISLFSLAPVVVGKVVNIQLEMNGLMNMWLSLHMFFGAALFLQSLHTDMKEPDLWFHSPASIWKLLGVKGLMAVLLNFGSFLLCIILAGIAYYNGSAETIFVDLTIIFRLLVNMCFIISVGLLIWVLYKILELKIGWFAAVISVIFISIGSMVWGILIAIWETMGPFVGVLPYIFISIALYAGGATLLDKKVRY